MKDLWKYLKVILAVVVTGAIVWILWAAWQWITALHPAILATWAALATLLLPVVALGSWALGRYEATALMKGIDMGIDRVAGAVIKLRTREPKAPIQIAVLPQLPSVTHQQLTDGKGEMINL